MKNYNLKKDLALYHRAITEEKNLLARYTRTVQKCYTFNLWKQMEIKIRYKYREEMLISHSLQCYQ